MRPNPTGRTISRLVVAIVVLAASYHLSGNAALPNSGAPPNSQATATAPGTGLITTTFTTAGGSKIIVNQTDDLSAGDTFSGTVIVEPAGKTDAERAASEGELTGDVIEMGNQKVPVTGKTFKWAIPAGFAGTAEALILRNSAGQELARKNVPVAAGTPTQNPANPSPEDFHLPTVGQAGHPIQVQGPFNGDFTDTAVKVGGAQAMLLAESPRKLVARSPENVVGPTEIQCSQGNVTATGPFRNVAVKLTGDTTLQRNQKAPLNLTVSGLQGLQQDMPLSLTNRSTGVVDVAQGNSQTITIHPADVKADGTYQTSRMLTGKQAGGFDIVATIFAAPGMLLHLKAFSDPPPGVPEDKHVKGITYPPTGVDHVKDVSWPPEGMTPADHLKGVSWGLPGQGKHVKGKTWPDDTGGSVPGGDGKDVPPTHKEGITWPPKGIPGQGKSAPNWPDHTKGITWPPYHVAKVSWPTHTQGITWAPKDINPVPAEGQGPAPYDWPKHLTKITWPPRHNKGITPPPHISDVTWPPYHIKDKTDPKHQKSGTWPKQ